MPTSIVPMITCEQLKGAYSEGEALAVYHEVCRQGDFAAFCREFMHNADYQVARNALWCLTKASHEEIRQCQPLLHQLIDLALLQNGMLKGAALDKFLKRSIELIK